MRELTPWMPGVDADDALSMEADEAFAETLRYPFVAFVFIFIFNRCFHSLFYYL